MQLLPVEGNQNILVRVKPLLISGTWF